MNGGASLVLALKNSRHFMTQPLVSSRNEASGTTAEFPHWWHVTTQIWVVLLIGRRCRVKNSLQPIRSTLGSNLSSVWNFFSRFSDLFSRGITVGVAKYRLFSLAPLTSLLRPSYAPLTPLSHPSYTPLTPLLRPSCLVFSWASVVVIPRE